MPFRSVARRESATSYFSARDSYDTPTKIREARKKLSRMKIPNTNGISCHSSKWLLFPSNDSEDPGGSFPGLEKESELSRHYSTSPSLSPPSSTLSGAATTEFQTSSNPESFVTHSVTEIQSLVESLLDEAADQGVKIETTIRSNIVESSEVVSANTLETTITYLQNSETSVSSNIDDVPHEDHPSIPQNIPPLQKSETRIHGSDEVTISIEPESSTPTSQKSESTISTPSSSRISTPQPYAELTTEMDDTHVEHVVLNIVNEACNSERENTEENLLDSAAAVSNATPEPDPELLQQRLNSFYTFKS